MKQGGLKVNKVIHCSDNRGLAEYDWVHSRYTFYFASYYDPDRVGLGSHECLMMALLNLTASEFVVLLKSIHSN